MNAAGTLATVICVVSESTWKIATTPSAGCLLCLYLACRTINIVPGVLAVALSESVNFVTPLTSPVHRTLRDPFNDLLDSSEDTTGQEVSKDATESISVVWEGSQEERKVWLRG